MSDETYNGWKNRETWAVNLRVENEQYLYESRNEMLQQLTEDDNPGSRAKEWFETELENLAEVHPEFRSELLEDIGSLWRVDWDELGQMWIDDFDL